MIIERVTERIEAFPRFRLSLFDVRGGARVQTFVEPRARNGVFTHTAPILGCSPGGTAKRAVIHAVIAKRHAPTRGASAKLLMLV